MNPIRRELLNGLFVLVLSTLLSAAIAAFQIKFNLQVWVLILVAAAVALGGYVVFEFVLSAEYRETEWLKRVGTPARLEIGDGGGFQEAVKAMSHGSDYTALLYIGAEGEVPGSGLFTEATADKTLALILEQVRRGTIREYKRIICFEPDVLTNDQELRSGVLRVGEGPGTINRGLGKHCRLMMESKGCSLFVAPAVLKSQVVMFGLDKVAMTVETTKSNRVAGFLFFCDPPNGEIIEQLRQMERETERRMVAVHKIVFPEDAVSTKEVASR